MPLSEYPNGVSDHGQGLISGAIVPQSAGNYFFVSSVSGSNSNDGLSPLRPKATVANALTSCVAGRGDVIMCMPGHTETITTALAFSKNDVHLIGLGRCSLTASASDIMDLTGDGVEIAGFHLTIASTKIGLDMQGADRCRIHDNTFNSSVGGAASHFILMNTTACNFNYITNNRFLSFLDVSAGTITQTSQVTGLGIGNVIEHNFLVAGRVTTANAGVVTDGVVFLDAADAGNFVRHNTFIEFNGATFTAGYRTGASTVSGAAIPVENNFLLATAANAVVNTAGTAGFQNNIANGTV